MSQNRKLLAGVAGALIIGLIVWRFFGSGDAAKKGDHAHAIPVVAGQVSVRDVALNLAGIGTVQAYNTVTIHARVDGELTNVAFREGQDVKKGDLLAQIDPRPFQAALDNALASLAKDQATLDNAKRDLARYQDTAAKGYSSRQQLDTQVSTVNSLTAAVQADAATVENARVQLGYTSIVSPLDGRTGIRQIDQGNIVHAADAGGLVVITQVQPISAIFTLPQDTLATVTAAEAQGPLNVSAFSRDGVTPLGQGTLELVDNQIDPTTGTIRLKARFPNEQRTLWPGEFINVRLQVGDKPNGLTVDPRVVQRGVNGTFAYVIKADNTIEMRPVEVGQENDGQVLIKKGLNAGERVIVDGQLKVQPGSKVQLVDENGNSVQAGAVGAIGAIDGAAGSKQDAAIR